MGTNNGKNPLEIKIRLQRANDDPSERDPAFQSELRTFGGSLRAAAISYSQRGMAFDAATVTGYALAEFIIKELGPAAIGVLGTAAGAWITGRNGRKVRLKVGDIEAEARTKGEVEQLLQHAQALQARQMSAKDEANGSTN